MIKLLLKFAFKAGVLTLASLFILSVVMLPAAERAGGGIYDKTLRLHIRANSDDARDQELKLKVRDGVISFLTPLLEDCSSSAECVTRARSLEREIEEEAKKVLCDEGCDLPVCARIAREYYPTREYGDCAYPAGVYDSLEISIGEGAGQNWWCVVFPPLCLDRSASQDDALKSGYTDGEAATVKREGAGEVRFFLLDLIAKIRHWFD